MLRIQTEALTYDDVSLVPAHSIVLPKDVSFATAAEDALMPEPGSAHATV